LFSHVSLSSVLITYSQTCIKRSPLVQRISGLLRQVNSLTGQEKGDILIEVTA